ncbi:hypothetical protein [Galbibacter sp. BG1]
MRLSIGKEESIADIMRPMTKIVDRLRAFRERALSQAEMEDADAKAAAIRAQNLRQEAEEADRLAAKYS